MFSNQRGEPLAHVPLILLSEATLHYPVKNYVENYNEIKLFSDSSSSPPLLQLRSLPGCTSTPACLEENRTSGTRDCLGFKLAAIYYLVSALDATHVRDADSSSNVQSGGACS